MGPVDEVSLDRGDISRRGPPGQKESATRRVDSRLLLVRLINDPPAGVRISRGIWRSSEPDAGKTEHMLWIPVFRTCGENLSLGACGVRIMKGEQDSLFLYNGFLFLSFSFFSGNTMYSAVLSLNRTRVFQLNLPDWGKTTSEKRDK